MEGYGFEMDVMKERARHAVPLRFFFKRRQELRLLFWQGMVGQSWLERMFVRKLAPKRTG